MPTHPLRILLVDDDEEDAILFSSALKSVDATALFTHVPDSSAALDLLCQAGYAPDFIFMDINMPGMNGKECLGKIKQQPHLRHIPVIMHSTSNHRHDIEDTRALGASYYTIKPMMYKALEQMIRFIIKEQHPAGTYLEQTVVVF